MNKSRILENIFKHHKTNRSHQDYPQTWWIVVKLNPKIQKVIQSLCERFGGHEMSKTECGYGGGDYADVWCRWCNKLIKVPKTSLYFTHNDFKPFMKLINSEPKKDI